MTSSDLPSLDLALVCPTCRTPLPSPDDTPWRCAECGARYFRAGRTPILVADSCEYIRQARRGLMRYRTRQQQLLAQAHRLVEETCTPCREALLHRTIEATAANLALTDAQLQALARLPVREAASEEPEDPAFAAVRHYGLHNMRYLRTDWGGTARGEEQIRSVLARIRPQLDRYNPDGGPTVFLGAGTGRYVFECARQLRASIGVELCFSYVDLFQRLLHGAVTFGDCNLTEPVAAESAAAVRVATMPAERELLVRTHYLIADAARLPMADASLGAVVSVYFTDVMPLAVLLTEMRRVLQPGRAFIHCGPLHYHFTDIEHSLTPDDMRHVASQLGFVVEEDEWFDLPFFRNDSPGSYNVHRVWSCAFVRA